MEMARMASRITGMSRLHGVRPSIAFAQQQKQAQNHTQMIHHLLQCLTQLTTEEREIRLHFILNAGATLLWMSTSPHHLFFFFF